MLPVNLQNDGSHDGLAEDRQAAIAIARTIYAEPDWIAESVAVRVHEREIGRLYDSRSEMEKRYADETAEGWVTARQVYGGWKAVGEYWDITATERT